MMPRYRLTAAHFSEEDKWLAGDKENEFSNAPVTGRTEMADGTVIEHRGTIVGDGTPHKWTRPPTPEMVGLDKLSEKLVEEAKKLGDGLDPIDKLPLTMGVVVTGGASG